MTAGVALALLILTTTASLDATAHLWDAATSKELAVLRGHTGWVTSAAFSPDGARIVTGRSTGGERHMISPARAPTARLNVSGIPAELASQAAPSAMRDAAGHSDPQLGQGLSIAMRDVRILSELLLSSDDWSAAAGA